MVDETKEPEVVKTQAPAAVAPVKPAGEAELMAQLQEALKTNDFKVIAKVSNELVKFQKTKEQAELEARQKAVEGTTDKVKGIIAKALKPMYEAGELDVGDGVWFGWDFGEQLVACKLLKSQAKARTGGGGGGGKKFSISTNDMLVKYGGQEYKDGVTFQTAWDADTDKNKRYAIRESLLKLEGLIS